jgi:hypothetical protein
LVKLSIPSLIEVVPPPKCGFLQRGGQSPLNAALLTPTPKCCYIHGVMLIEQFPTAFSQSVRSTRQFEQAMQLQTITILGKIGVSWGR